MSLLLDRLFGLLAAGESRRATGNKGIYALFSVGMDYGLKVVGVVHPRT